MVECPECHTKIERKDLIKEWSATPNAKPDEIHVTIHYWQCPGCGHKFRIATRTWPEKSLKQKLKDALG